jgi:hypothetical protein
MEEEKRGKGNEKGRKGKKNLLNSLLRGKGEGGGEEGKGMQEKDK